MRPVERGPRPARAVEEYGDWRQDLVERLGAFCSYCEMPLTSPVNIEHKIPKDQDATLEQEWTNLLLACHSCNSSRPKRGVVLNDYVWPDVDNTFRAFLYTDTGEVTVASGLGAGLGARVAKTLAHFGLDKHPGQSAPQRRATPSDRRWLMRHEALAKAERFREKLAAHESAELREAIVDLARMTGFFSVWMRVFQDDRQMRYMLIEVFSGTDRRCFGPDCEPLPRVGGCL